MATLQRGGTDYLRPNCHPANEGVNVKLSSTKRQPERYLWPEPIPGTGDIVGNEGTMPFVYRENRQSERNEQQKEKTVKKNEVSKNTNREVWGRD